MQHSYEIVNDIYFEGPNGEHDSEKPSGNRNAFSFQSQAQLIFDDINDNVRFEYNRYQSHSSQNHSKHSQNEPWPHPV